MCRHLSALNYTIAVGENKARTEKEITLGNVKIGKKPNNRLKPPCAKRATIRTFNNKYPPLNQSTDYIRQQAQRNEARNQRFRLFLEQQDGAVIDQRVQALNRRVEAAIDCTRCGNCCRSLLINVTAAESDTLARHLQMERTDFDERYLEKGMGATLLMNTVPCPFLTTSSTCSVYTERPAGCREFPALHLPHFTRRLFTVFMHYDRCPIVFHVVEQLREELQFS